jgi:uncharacterized protein (DUF1501 family)
MREIAGDIRRGKSGRTVFADLGGWDHHVDQAGALGSALREYAEGMRGFWDQMGERMDDVVVVTVSEFGRAARENGTRGTDHGRAGCMLVMGGGVKGGKVYGRWPGLRKDQLHEGRDLAATGDWRDALEKLTTRR